MLQLIFLYVLPSHILENSYFKQVERTAAFGGICGAVRELHVENIFEVE